MSSPTLKSPREPVSDLINHCAVCFLIILWVETTYCIIFVSQSQLLIACEIKKSQLFHLNYEGYKCCQLILFIIASLERIKASVRFFSSMGAGICEMETKQQSRVGWVMDAQSQVSQVFSGSYYKNNGTLIAHNGICVHCSKGSSQIDSKQMKKR